MCVLCECVRVHEFVCVHKCACASVSVSVCMCTGVSVYVVCTPPCAAGGGEGSV